MLLLEKTQLEALSHKLYRSKEPVYAQWHDQQRSSLMTAFIGAAPWVLKGAMTPYECFYEGSPQR
jgi:hypothetical protein